MAYTCNQVGRLQVFHVLQAVLKLMAADILDLRGILFRSVQFNRGSLLDKVTERILRIPRLHGAP